MNYTKEINSALRKFSEGKKEYAYKKLKKIFISNQGNDQLRFNLAVIAQSLNLNNEAKDYYNFLINKNNNLKAMTNLYHLYLKETNYLNALDIIKKLLNSNFNSDEIIKDKAFVLYKLKRYSESINVCKSFLKLNNDLNFHHY